MRGVRQVSFAITAACALATSSRAAVADDTIKHPGDHPSYTVEIEPHLDFAWADFGAGGTIGGEAGFGVGARVSFPIVRNGFVPSINNSVAIGVGLDYLYFGCGSFIAPANDNYSCSVNSLSLPVVLQWNFYVSRAWSVFGEPGLFLYHQFIDLSCGAALCTEPSTTGLLPALYVGGRYHFNDRLSLTMRVGYPTLNVGLSFFD